MRNLPSICLIGHPFAPIGCGENIRAGYRSLKAAGIDANIIDIYGLHVPEDSFFYREISKKLTKNFGEINIFYINGDEVTQVLSHLDTKKFSNAINIVVPNWELSNYPEEWAKNLDRFDYIWAPTKFIYDCLIKVVKKPLKKVLLASEVNLESMLPRRFFGIPEESYAFLFSFDFRSFLSRKNPEAVIECFKKLLELRPLSKVVLVLKMHGVGALNKRGELLLNSIRELGEWAVMIDQSYSDNEMRNLLRVCDCYISLHRSEGYGRGLSEAMSLGKPVIATRYSGNLDFMNEDNSLLVDYRLIDLQEGDYPFWKGQKWAEPNIDQAILHMLNLVDMPLLGYSVGKKAAISIKKTVGYRACGVAMKDELILCSLSNSYIN